MMEIDVVIPTYRPGNKFIRLIEMLEKQTVPVHKIIVMNTEEKWFESRFYGTPFLKEHPSLEVHHLSKKEFDHARTRDAGARRSETEVFVCMTDDAVPEDETLLEQLLKALEQKDVAVAYARQLPAEDCQPIECFARTFNYPEQSLVKGKEDLERLGIKTFFCSNVCAAYRKDIYQELGGFQGPAIFNEDMVYAAGAVKAGYRIAYAAQARVVHSHNYGNLEYFRRNFDLGVSQARHPEVFAGLPSEGEGIRMVKRTAAYLRRQGEKKLLGRLFLQSACKYAGFRLGRAYRCLPRRLVKKCSSNREYWENSYFL